MKKKRKIFIVFTTLIFFVVSCAKEDDKPLDSDREKFLGSWITTSTGAVHGTLNFTMTITAGASSPTQIKMENFDQEGTGTFIFGEVGGTAVSIAQQVIGSDTIQGSGSYNSNGTLTFNYSVRDGQSVDNRTANAHK